MTLYNRYLTFLALLFVMTAVVLGLYNQQQLDLYFSLYLIEYLAVTLLMSQLHPRAHYLLNSVGYVLSIGFAVIVVAKVIQTLGLRLF